jgi:hypothetical protein
VQSGNLKIIIDPSNNGILYLLEKNFEHEHRIVLKKGIAVFLEFGSLEAVIRSFSLSLRWFCWPGRVTHWFLNV